MKMARIMHEYNASGAFNVKHKKRWLVTHVIPIRDNPASRCSHKDPGHTIQYAIGYNPSDKAICNTIRRKDKEGEGGDQMTSQPISPARRRCPGARSKIQD